MSNSEPSAIVLQGIPCIGGLYTRFDSNGENGSLVVRSGFAANVRRQRSPRFTLSRSRMRSRTGLASPVENQACGIAKYPRLRVHRHCCSAGWMWSIDISTSQKEVHVATSSSRNDLPNPRDNDLHENDPRTAPLKPKSGLNGPPVVGF